MDNAREIIVQERLRHAPLWSKGARGIYANYSKYPDEIEWYTKCPRCGDVHGSYKSFKEAHGKKFCAVCDREDVDKLKDWVKDAIHPPQTKPGQKPKKFPTAAKVLGIKENEEGIRAAAVRAADGSVYEAPAHFAAVQKANMDGKTVYDEEESLGFVTTAGRFVDRNEAELIGLRMGQLRPDIQEPGLTHAADFDHYL